MSAWPLRSAATSALTEGSEITRTFRPAWRNKPSLMPMNSGASATSYGAAIVTVPEPVGPWADEEPPGIWHPATTRRPAAAAVTPAARRPGRLTVPPHLAQSRAETRRMALLGARRYSYGHFGNT